MINQIISAFYFVFNALAKLLEGLTGTAFFMQTAQNLLIFFKVSFRK